MILRYLKRLLMGIGLITVLSTCVSLFVMARGPKMPAHSILRVTLDGPLPEAPSTGFSELLGGEGTPSLALLTERIRAAAEDDRIDGLLLEIKRPEVGLAQAEALGRAVKDFRASKKWCQSFFESAGEGSRGDGAYLLATMANEVVMAPPGEINLMGMRTDAPFGQEALQRLHVVPHVEQRYEYKTFAEMFSEKGFTEAHRESVASLLDDLQGRFLELVAEARHTEVAVAKRWVFDAPFNGAQALAEHLVDRVAYWDEVEDAAKAVVGDQEDPFLDVADYLPKAKKTKGEVPVALIVAQGEIDRGSSSRRPMGGEHMGSETLTEAFREARADKVQAVLLRIDSPGGSYLASDVIRREVELTRNHNIPVVVSMGNVAASGGYFMAIDADHIVVEPGSITGSIGVVSLSFALREALHRLFGVTFDSYASLPAPSALGFLDPPEGVALSRMRSEVDRIYRDFVGKVAAARHLTYEEAHAVAKGRVWTGRQALARGLVDELGGLDTAQAYLRRRLELAPDHGLKLNPYPEPETPWSLLRDLAEGQIATSAFTREVLPHAARAWSLASQALQAGIRAQGDLTDANRL